MTAPEIIKSYYESNYKLKDVEILKNDSINDLINSIIVLPPNDKKYYDRLLTELNLIHSKKFTKVFQQVIQILKLIDPSIPTVIRGSAGSSLICFLLGITTIDPILFNISLARFMHEDRNDLPDIDIDFPSHLREDIYEKIYKQYPNRVARISNHLYYKPKSAIREAIRQCGYRKFVPRDFNLNKIFEDKTKVKQAISIADDLKDTFRGYSLHCGGIIIFDEEVPEDLKLIKDEKEIKKLEKKNKTIHTQIKLNKDDAEEANLIKIDILSNRGLSQLSVISKKKLNQYDWEDLDVWKFLSDGNNIGLTHAESPAMKKVLRLVKPRSIQDLAFCLAIIRPGATATGNKGHYLRNFYNSYMPKDDKNIIVFDDDAIQTIQKIMGTNESKADLIRRAFTKGMRGKKLQDEFKRKLDELKYTYVQKELLLFQLTQLEDYTFCKSHAFSYALLTFALAYHKLYNPKKFWTATLNYAHSSYRNWVHYRAAINNGLNVPYGSGYYKRDGENLYVEKEAHTFNNKIKDFYTYGFWNQPDFLPNMYISIDNKVITENNKMVKNIEFRGLIAIYRTYANTTQAPNITTIDKTKYTEKEEEKHNKLTFVTIGVDNNIFYDCVLWGFYPVSKFNTIRGEGIYHFRDASPWIEVKKFRLENVRETTED